MRIWGSRNADATCEVSKEIRSVPAPEKVEKALKTHDYSLPGSHGAKHWNPDNISPVTKHAAVRDWLTTIGLMSNEDYLIDPDIEEIRMGLGWDKGADVDASAVLFDEHLRVVDVVWYKKLKSTCRSVVHSGDNLTGAGDGDDEVISVNMTQLPLHIHHVLFTVCVFSYELSFRQIKSAYVRMMPEKDGYRHHQMCYYSLTQMSGHAMLMGVLTRKGAYWNFRALGTPASGRNVIEMLANPRNLQCLSAGSSFSPTVRQVTVGVLKGTGLPAKDYSGFFRRTASSDPYYVLEFRNKKYTSEHRAQTLEPEWRLTPFAIGWVTEIERKPLEIRLFDYNVMGKDTFMGEVKIPVYALFDLGPGKHSFWFTLGDSKKKEYRNEHVSGQILVSFEVQDSAA